MERFENVIYEKDGSISRIILNRPEKLNALNLPTMYEIDRALTEAEEDDEIKEKGVAAASRAKLDFCKPLDK